MKKNESSLYINENGKLCEAVDFGSEKVEYELNCIIDHPKWGVFLAYRMW